MSACARQRGYRRQLPINPAASPTIMRSGARRSSAVGAQAHAALNNGQSCAILEARRGIVPRRRRKSRSARPRICHRQDRLGREPGLSHFSSGTDVNQATRAEPVVVVGALVKKMRCDDAADRVGYPEEWLSLGAPVVPEWNTAVVTEGVKENGTVALVGSAVAPLDDQVVHPVIGGASGVFMEKALARFNLAAASDRTPEAGREKTRALNEVHHARNCLGSFLSEVERPAPLADHTAQFPRNRRWLGDLHPGEHVVHTRPSLRDRLVHDSDHAVVGTSISEDQIRHRRSFRRAWASTGIGPKGCFSVYWFSAV